MKTMIRLEGTWGDCLDHRQNSDNAGTGTGLIGSLAREKEHHREERDDHREARKGLHGLIAGSGERLDQRHGRDAPPSIPSIAARQTSFRVGSWLSRLWIASSSSSIIAKSVRA
jgi:hypothetical protein